MMSPIWSVDSRMDADYSPRVRDSRIGWTLRRRGGATLGQRGTSARVSR